MAKVALGNGYKTTQDMRGITDPPAGYHSVLGEVGGSLNKDECIVYNEEAAIPSYLIVYSC